MKKLQKIALILLAMVLILAIEDSITGIGADWLDSASWRNWFQWHATINGEEVSGLRGMALGMSGLLIGVIAVAFALVVAAIASAGTSLLLVVLLGLVGLALLAMFSPLLVPFALVLLVVVITKRKAQKQRPK